MTRPAVRTAILADDHPLVLRGLVDLLMGEPDFVVLASTTNGRDALREIRAKAPDLAVLDLVMPELTGLQVLQELMRERSKTRVIFLSALITPEQSFEAIAIGAWGILLKESAPETLIECMRTVGGGERWLPENLFSQARPESGLPDETDDTSKLTSREREIANLVAAGHSNKVIAAMLAVSEGTVKIHLHNIFTKLDVLNRTTLAAKFLSQKKPN